ncbi:MAG: cell division protein FtsQ/DivIB [Gammaproteobacteria bacterium]|nr:cell division protein FtsQ/DivIB [Gammaproteobacteria bacterium]
MITSHVRNRYKDFKFSWKFAAKALGFIVFIYLLTLAFNQFKSAHYFAIKEVRVVGVHNSQQQSIQKILLPLVNKGFFLVDVDLIKEKLLQFPWISTASVKRVWPAEIIIQVREKNPVARWNEQSLLSSNGEIFTPEKATFPAGLPEFVAPEGEQIHMLKYYSQLTLLLKPLNIKMLRFELSDAQSWSVTFDNGMKLNVGYKDILTHISHFVKVYPKIIGERANQVDYVDLRYSNGLAIHWKKII